MANHTRLSRPPLREAILDIQTTDSLPSSFTKALESQVIPGYERVGPVRQSQFSFQIGPTLNPQAAVMADEILGFRYDSLDKSRIVQLKRNGMTYSILREYTDWNQMKATAKAMWERYIASAGQVHVQRLALRYINVIDLPLGADFDEYLTSGPKIPPELPQLVASFFHRIVVPFPEMRLEAIVTQATEPQPPTHWSLVLDIDVYGQDQLAVSDEEMWAQFDTIRDIKNLIFFSFVTEKALTPYR